MISQTAEYALRSVVFLAEHPEGPFTIQQIAKSTQVPSGYLAKVMQELARRGIVSSQRGLGGGFSLARPAADMTIYEVVQAVDPIMRITRCPLNLPEHRDSLCSLHRQLDEAAAMLEERFRSTTVAQLVQRPVFGEVLADDPVLGCACASTLPAASAP